MSTLTVVEEVLRAANKPMSVREIVDAAGSALPSKSKTPDTVVARDLSMDIKRKSEGSLFVRTSPGRYTLRALVARVDGAAAAAAVSTAVVAPQPVPVQPAQASVMSQALGGERVGTRPAPAPAASAAKRNEDTSMLA